MSDTPRTDGVIHNIAELGVFARQLERELNAAQSAIRQQQLLDEEILRLRERVKRLEQAGDDMAKHAEALGMGGTGLVRRWKEAKP